MADTEDADSLLRAIARAPDAESVPDVAFSDDEVRIGATLTPGSRMGRFEIGEVIGAGGMGVVYQATDPTLGRQVALKLLRGSRGSSRLLREAQALAKLSHPNVVTVYEAGRDGERVFVAMERVEGTTARAWRAAAPRSRHEILRVYQQAAAGLAAAHARGLVHRDVKPENILVGDDGRVRVTDFGLVAAQGSDAPATTPPDGTMTLTRTGAAVGTPPYMPPEAHLGREADARGDQWSLCVSLWEALAGERPFAGQTYAELADAVCAGAITRGRAKVPARLLPALERGLAVDPAARWPSIDALALALARPPRRWRRAVAPIAALAVAGGAVTTFLLIPRGERAIAPPIAHRMTPPGACPYMPAYVDDRTIVLDDGNGALQVIRGDGAPATLASSPGRVYWRASRGRRAGEAVFVNGGENDSDLGFVDTATGAITEQPFSGSSFAVGGDTLYYSRTDLPEVRRVRGGEDATAFRMPDGLWPYTVAASADGARVAVTTALDRSAPQLCLSEGGADPSCLDRDDVIAGRAAFAPAGDVIYYQTRAGIRRRSLATGDDALWLPGAYAYGGIDVAPGGGALVYSDAHPGDMMMTTLDGRTLDLGDASPPVSAAGHWFYSRHVEGGDQLVDRDADGIIRVLAGPFPHIGNMTVATDGRRVAFDVDGDDAGVYLVDTHPYPALRLTTTAGDSNPIVLDDGRVAFTRWDAHMSPHVFVADPETGAITPGPNVPHVTVTRGPGGSVVLGGIEGASLWLWTPGGEPRPVDVAGLGGRQVLQAAMAPDGDWLAVETQGSTYELWRLALPGSTAHTEQLLAQPDCVTFAGPVFDTSGTVWIPEVTWRGDVWRVDLP